MKDEKPPTDEELEKLRFALVAPQVSRLRIVPELADILRRLIKTYLHPEAMGLVPLAEDTRLAEAEKEATRLRLAYEQMSRDWHKVAHHGGAWEDCDGLCYGHHAALAPAEGEEDRDG